MTLGYPLDLQRGTHMSMTAKMRRAPTRLVTGAYILNAGLGKVRGNEDTAKAIHGMATNAFPVLDKVEPKIFLRALGVGEVALGATLLLPLVPAAVAGAGLLAFSGGLLGLYWRTPHLHLENDPRPTQDGVALPTSRAFDPSFLNGHTCSPERYASFGQN